MNVETPKLAVDVVVYYVPTKVFVLIERKFPPLGLALPGGFVDVGESCEAAACREMKEELNIDLEPQDLHMVGVYSEPTRDPRRHVVSVAYYATTAQFPVAGDDARTIVMVGIDEVDKHTLCFDHRKIIGDCLKSKF